MPAMTPVLGAGWGFPLRCLTRPETAEAHFAWAADEASVSQSVQIILATAKGERAMRPDFGSNLHTLLFAPNTGATRAAAAFEVQDALTTWEPRIDVLGVEVLEGDEPSLLLIEVAYRVRGTDNRFNLVYPFYLDRTAA